MFSFAFAETLLAAATPPRLNPKFVVCGRSRAVLCLCDACYMQPAYKAHIVAIDALCKSAARIRAVVDCCCSLCEEKGSKVNSWQRQLNENNTSYCKDSLSFYRSSNQWRMSRYVWRWEGVSLIRYFVSALRAAWNIMNSQRRRRMAERPLAAE